MLQNAFTIVYSAYETLLRRFWLLYPFDSPHTFFDHIDSDKLIEFNSQTFLGTRNVVHLFSIYEKRNKKTMINREYSQLHL